MKHLDSFDLFWPQNQQHLKKKAKTKTTIRLKMRSRYSLAIRRLLLVKIIRNIREIVWLWFFFIALMSLNSGKWKWLKRISSVVHFEFKPANFTTFAHRSASHFEHMNEMEQTKLVWCLKNQSLRWIIWRLCKIVHFVKRPCSIEVWPDNKMVRWAC